MTPSSNLNVKRTVLRAWGFRAFRVGVYVRLRHFPHPSMPRESLECPTPRLSTRISQRAQLQSIPESAWSAQTSPRVLPAGACGILGLGRGRTSLHGCGSHPKLGKGRSGFTPRFGAWSLLFRFFGSTTQGTGVMKSRDTAGKHTRYEYKASACVAVLLLHAPCRPQQNLWHLLGRLSERVLREAFMNILMQVNPRTLNPETRQSSRAVMPLRPKTASTKPLRVGVYALEAFCALRHFAPGFLRELRWPELAEFWALSIQAPKEEQVFTDVEVTPSVETEAQAKADFLGVSGVEFAVHIHWN